MGNDPNFTFLKTFFSARIERLRNVRDDRGSVSIETMMIVAGLVVVAAIAAAVILTKVNEKANEIK
ncbi:hypothetical protein ACN6AT_38725 (plasmid) [Streptomyces sp. JL4002]|jgi:hypothetical protein|uniref:Uncharacterized protein n=3 Tax=Streptomyces TaxID=1883 RepID=A0ABS2VRK3_STRAS|nr:MULTISPECIES: hypothetical protein [Streptomyces]WUC76565.1 hypothetical protein OG416_37730 [Streptomyces longwoodensis]AHE39341.1 Hypothetical protein pFRL4_108 [Streptomyces sp. F2]MBN0045713.1 hypothetical protein [Streptomyces actuosus]MCX4624567.1 hypothetical protein [Streptomyces viridodiastaticus]QQM47549.1 hypothetical protein JEQ17_49270 [Streptomyces liliifuscus]